MYGNSEPPIKIPGMNQNSRHLIVLPAWIYWLFRKYKNRSQLTYFFSGILLGGGVYALSQSFYWLNPEYAFWNEKPVVMLDFDWNRMIKGFGNLALFFQNSFPVVFNHAVFFFLLPAGVLAAAACYRKWNLFFPVFAVVLILAALPGFARFYIGTDSVFHSCSRFFLPIPVLLVMMAMLLENQYKTVAGLAEYRFHLIAAVFVLGMIAGVYNFRNLPPRVEEEIRIGQYWLSIGRVDRLYALAEFLDKRLQEHRTFVIVMSDYLDAYAYSALSRQRYLGLLPPRIERRKNLYFSAACARRRDLTAVRASISYTLPFRREYGCRRPAGSRRDPAEY